MSTMKCFTKAEIIKANRLAIKRNYNRQIEPGFLNNLPEDKVFPAFFVMPHEHAAGVRVPMHYRCWVAFDDKGTSLFIDCDAKLFNSLIEITVPDRKEAQ